MNETILQILREAGMKVTRQRESILSIFLEADTRLTAEDLFLRLRERNEEYSLATVYRTLSALAEPPCAGTGGTSRSQLPVLQSGPSGASASADLHPLPQNASSR